MITIQDSQQGLAAVKTRGTHNLETKQQILRVTCSPNRRSATMSRISGIKDPLDLAFAFPYQYTRTTRTPVSRMATGKPHLQSPPPQISSELLLPSCGVALDGHGSRGNRRKCGGRSPHSSARQPDRSSPRFPSLSQGNCYSLFLVTILVGNLIESLQVSAAESPNRVASYFCAQGYCCRSESVKDDNVREYRHQQAEEAGEEFQLPAQMAQRRALRRRSSRGSRER